MDESCKTTSMTFQPTMSCSWYLSRTQNDFVTVKTIHLCLLRIEDIWVKKMNIRQRVHFTVFTSIYIKQHSCFCMRLINFRWAKVLEHVADTCFLLLSCMLWCNSSEWLILVLALGYTSESCSCLKIDIMAYKVFVLKMLYSMFFNVFKWNLNLLSYIHPLSFNVSNVFSAQQTQMKWPCHSNIWRGLYTIWNNLAA